MGPPPSLTSPAPPPKKSRRGLYAVIAVVIVVVLLLALLLSGVIPGLKLSTSKSSSPAATFTVYFNETGLPSGTEWSVTLAGTMTSGHSTSLSFSEPNGTYSFTVGSVAGYSASPSSGTLTVSGTAITEKVTFTPLPAGSYTVTFTETGLPTGTSWSVTFNGSTLSGTTTTISFTAKNGSYPFTAGTVSGYTATPGSGTIVVHGGPAGQTITYTTSVTSGQAETYSQAAPVGNSTVSPHTTGSFRMVAAEGLDIRVAYSNSTSNETNSTCTITGGQTSFTLPTFTGNYHSGVAVVWIFIYYQPSPEAVFYAAVVNGTGEYFGEGAGAGCVNTVDANATVPAHVIDSSTAAAAVASDAAAYIAANATSNAFYDLLGGYNETIENFTYHSPPIWIVDYFTCNSGYTGSGTEFLGEVNATSGAVIATETLPETCTGGPLTISHGTPIALVLPRPGIKLILASAPRD